MLCTGRFILVESVHVFLDRRLFSFRCMYSSLIPKFQYSFFYPSVIFQYMFFHKNNVCTKCWLWAYKLCCLFWAFGHEVKSAFTHIVLSRSTQRKLALDRNILLLHYIIILIKDLTYPRFPLKNLEHEIFFKSRVITLHHVTQKKRLKNGGKYGILTRLFVYLWYF